MHTKIPLGTFFRLQTIISRPILTFLKLIGHDNTVLNANWLSHCQPCQRRVSVVQRSVNRPFTALQPVTEDRCGTEKLTTGAMDDSREQMNPLLSRVSTRKRRCNVRLLSYVLGSLSVFAKQQHKSKGCLIIIRSLLLLAGFPFLTSP